MTVIAPFHGVRYRPERAGELAQVTAPPYDVISPEQLAALRRKSPYNIVHIDLPNAEGAQSENPYTQAGHRFRQWVQDGIMAVDERPALYAYRQRYRVPGTGEVRELMGFISALRLARWEEGIVLPHEHTFAKPKEDRLRLMRAGQANFSQVYSFYSDPQMAAEAALESAIAGVAPDMEVVEEDGAEHRVWVVQRAEAVSAVVQALAARQVYIADGHHRYETSIDYRDEVAPQQADDGANYIMMMLVNSAGGGLTVLPTHRMVRLPFEVDRAALRAGLAEHFVVRTFPPVGAEETVAQATQAIASDPAACALLWSDEVWILVPRDIARLTARIEADASDAWKRLGVTILHRLILEQHVGLGRDLQDDGEHITYTRDAVEAAQSVAIGRASLACLVNAPSPEAIMQVADANDAMPHKSTYFYPKLLTGLVLNDLTRPVGGA